MSRGAFRAIRCGRYAFSFALAFAFAFAGGDAAAGRKPAPGALGPRSKAALVEPRRESPEEMLARGRQAYLRSDFDGTVRAVRDLLYPAILLRSEEDVQNAHRLLALAYLFRREEAKAEDEFAALLQLNPNFTLDAVSDPPAAIAFLDRLRKRDAERVEDIERRRRDEAERARLDEEKRRAAEEEKRLKAQEERVRRSMKPVIIEKHSRALCLVPFGAGQFQNGQRAKGWVFFGTQLAFGATSVALWALLEYGPRSTTMSHTDWTARNIAMITAGGVFWADVAWGVIDALVHFQPEVRRAAPAAGPSAAPTPPAPPRPRTSLSPFLLPRGGGGLAVGGTF